MFWEEWWGIWYQWSACFPHKSELCLKPLLIIITYPGHYKQYFNEIIFIIPITVIRKHVWSSCEAVSRRHLSWQQAAICPICMIILEMPSLVNLRLKFSSQCPFELSKLFSSSTRTIISQIFYLFIQVIWVTSEHSFMVQQLNRSAWATLANWITVVS